MEVHCKRAAIESQLRYLCKIVAAGWPSWLATVAGEAIKGWLPRHADSFEKLDKLHYKQDPVYDFQKLAIQTEWLKDILMTIQLGDSVMNNLKNYVMAEEATKAMDPNADLLEWTKRDKRRLLHAVYRPVTLSVAMSELYNKYCSRTAKRHPMFDPSPSTMSKEDDPPAKRHCPSKSHDD
uniref:Uncharacterized protein n=1 Tax=Salix viminalis TaxID=40686 RepID=A0A6N2L4T6_SALVM